LPKHWPDRAPRRGTLAGPADLQVIAAATNITGGISHLAIESDAAAFSDLAGPRLLSRSELFHLRSRQKMPVRRPTGASSAAGQRGGLDACR
jgi:hypothetical protein